MKTSTCPPGRNVRYWLYAYSQGKSVEEQLAFDDTFFPGGVMTGFLIWMSERWREFCANQGVSDSREFFLKHGECGHAVFNEWLAAVVGAPVTSAGLVWKPADEEQALGRLIRGAP